MKADEARQISNNVIAAFDIEPYVEIIDAEILRRSQEGRYSAVVEQAVVRASLHLPHGRLLGKVLDHYRSEGFVVEKEIHNHPEDGRRKLSRNVISWLPVVYIQQAGRAIRVPARGEEFNTLANGIKHVSSLITGAKKEGKKALCVASFRDKIVWPNVVSYFDSCGYDCSNPDLIIWESLDNE